MGVLQVFKQKEDVPRLKTSVRKCRHFHSRHRAEITAVKRGCSGRSCKLSTNEHHFPPPQVMFDNEEYFLSRDACYQLMFRLSLKSVVYLDIPL